MKRLLATALVGFVACTRVASAASYTPVDCAKAAIPAEKTICGNYALGQAEARTATLFGIATSLVAMGQRADIGDAQRQWLQKRDTCGRNIGCLAQAYNDRIQQLNKVIDDIASRGPY